MDLITLVSEGETDFVLVNLWRELSALTKVDEIPLVPARTEALSDREAAIEV